MLRCAAVAAALRRHAAPPQRSSPPTMASFFHHRPTYKPTPGCHVYVSEGRDARVIARLRDVCRAQPGVALASAFVDAPYHRSSVALVSRSTGALAAAVAALAEAALHAIDLRAHGATHPRLGALDHVSCQPLPEGLDLGPARTVALPDGSSITYLVDDDGDDRGEGSSSSSSGSGTGGAGGVAADSKSSSGSGQEQRAASGAHASTSGRGGDAAAAAALEEAGRLARDIGARLGGAPCRLPVFLYGAARADGRPLADVRRALGYFGANAAGGAAWAGALAGGGDLAARGCAPDFGPSAADARAGVATVGAVPWIVNFNVPLAAGADLAAARRAARAVSARGGGLRGVEAMALAHAGGAVEVACNLLEPALSPPRAVRAAIEAAAAAEGLQVPRGGAYIIGKLPADIAAAADAAGV